MKHGYKLYVIVHACIFSYLVGGAGAQVQDQLEQYNEVLISKTTPKTKKTELSNRDTHRQNKNKGKTCNVPRLR